MTSKYKSQSKCNDHLLDGNEIESLRLSSQDVMLCEEIFYKDELELATDEQFKENDAAVIDCD